jgi:hypothetical protein
MQPYDVRKKLEGDNYILKLIKKDLMKVNKALEFAKERIKTLRKKDKNKIVEIVAEEFWL